MRSALLLMFVLTASMAAAQPRVTAVTNTPFQGSVPSGQATSTPLALTVIDAINRGLEHNLGGLLAEEGLQRAHGTRWNTLAAMLPNVSGRISETRQVINLAAFGFELGDFPTLVGPFNVFDARLHLSQSLFDLRAIRADRAERHAIAAAEYNVKSARDLVVLVAANAYLQALAGAARSEAVAAQAASAEAVFQQATRMKEAGVVAGIDVLRADVEWATERQRLTAAKNDFEKAKLQLARIIGLPIDQAFTLVDELPFVPVPDITLEAALAQAYTTRPDYLAALERVRQAEAIRDAASAEHLPTIQVDANYGALGLTVGDSRATYAVTGSVVVPLFNGGRTHARVLEADADLRTRRAEAEDLKAGIYYDIRNAFLDLQATQEQFDVASRARTLAAQQLEQARDRFAAGVANSVEVVQAQQAVAASSERYITALYGFNVAKALLARGIGVAEQAARQYLGGTRQ